MGFPRSAILFIALMTSTPAAMAMEVTNRPDFDAGVEAFRQGNLEEARIFSSELGRLAPTLHPYSTISALFTSVSAISGRPKPYS
ncbi:hypothetical protein AU15_03870 [Marinobacter salarius]|uniref:Tetratricopeptide repeat protein n=1 Tax=Marinobacter salarius TaxID=1420917 RepID=W5Z3D5_9GAMM|nr:hypothetical protein AU15_03870 [Marinobacter salarius]